MIEMEAKKISFGFSKTIKKTNLINEKATEKGEKIELIKCLEGKAIKLVEEPKPKELLIIPLVENQTTSAALASLIKRRAVLNNEDEPGRVGKAHTEKKLQLGIINESLEQRATRELLSEVETLDAENSINKTFVLPALKPEEIPLDGAKEPTLEDYETIPIKEFGRAMLRGMGWVDPPPEKETPLKSDAPIPRPKGMGLGADKACKPQPLLLQPEKNEILEIKPQAFVRILGGKLKERYGQIVSFDDYAGRVIVKMAIGGSTEIFNEFMCQPVAKKEYEKYAKCINTAKYEAYKSLENEYGQIIIKEESDMTSKGTDELSKKDEPNKGITRMKKEFELDYKYEGFKKSLKETSMDYKMHKRSDESINNKDCKNKSSNKTNFPEERKYPKSPPFRGESDYKEQSSSHGQRQCRATSNTSDSNSGTSRSAHHSRHRTKSSNSLRKNKKSKRKAHDNSSESEDDSPVTQKRHKSSKKKSKKGRKKKSRSRSRSRRR